jgi:hypothetical protein
VKKELFNELLESVEQAKAIERGILKPAREFHVGSRTDICRYAREPLKRINPSRKAMP